MLLQVVPLCTKFVHCKGSRQPRGENPLLHAQKECISELVSISINKGGLRPQTDSPREPLQPQKAFLVESPIDQSVRTVWP